MRLLTRIVLSGVLALASGHLMLAQHSGGHASVGGAYGGGHMGAAHFAAPAGAAPGNSFARSSGSYYSHANWSHSGSGNSYRRGYRSGYAYRYAHYPFSYFFTPYYYPILSYGTTPYYDDSSYPYDSYPYDSGDNGQYPPMEPQEDLAQNQPSPYESYGPNYPVAYPAPVPYAYQAPAAQPEELPPSPPVTIVLHDGQKFQVQSYAIMGQTFWDFSKQPVRKIPLSNIDIAASTKATIDSGAEFPVIQSGQ